MGTQLYVGNISFMTREGELERMFRKYGSTRFVSMKKGYAFVEFDHEKDAEDAMRHLNGRDVDGRRLRIEKAHGRGPRGPNRSEDYHEDRRRDEDHYHRSSRYEERRFSRSSNVREAGSFPRETPYRLTVKNLSTRCGWQELKGLMLSVAPVTYADAHAWEKNSGFVCFEDHSGLRRAIEKYQGMEINGRRIELIDDTRVNRSATKRTPPRKRSRASSRRSQSRTPPKRRHRTPPREEGGGTSTHRDGDEGKTNRRIEYP